MVKRGKKTIIRGSSRLIVSSDNALDFHDEILSLLLIFLKNLQIGWNTK